MARRILSNIEKVYFFVKLHLLQKKKILLFQCKVIIFPLRLSRVKHNYYLIDKLINEIITDGKDKFKLQKGIREDSDLRSIFRRDDLFRSLFIETHFQSKFRFRRKIIQLRKELPRN